MQMLESGPAAGALAAAYFGAREGAANLLAFDMGGTTAKLSLIEGGEPLVAQGFEAAPAAALHGGAADCRSGLRRWN